MFNIQFPEKKTNTNITEQKKMPSLNHSYICSRVLRQLFQNDKIEALTELTLDIDKGITPDISVYESADIHPNFSRDITRMSQLPMLSIEVISSSQRIQDVLEKSEKLVKSGIKTAWTIEPYTRTIFVTTENSENRFYNETIKTNNLQVDFKKVFS